MVSAGSATIPTVVAVAERGRRPWRGRTFVHPLFDYALIGGGLSLVTIPLVYFSGAGTSAAVTAALPWIILLSNSTHFAASTVRLYTKPGAKAALPFVTMALPAVTFLALTACVFRADLFGKYAQLLYLTWSPYHYAAQAYGVAVVYSYRSGCVLRPGHKRLLWWTAVLPFAMVSLQAAHRHVLPWFLPPETWMDAPRWDTAVAGLSHVLGALALVGPLFAYGLIGRSSSGPMPLISLLAILTNAAWFVLFPLVQGFVWVTVFHGVQYLAIVVIFHARDQMARSGNRHGAAWHAAAFYATSLVLGYGLFHCWPEFYKLLGFGATESLLMVVAAINVHHFIVDAYIWRLRPGDSNQRVVEAPAASVA